MSTAPSSPPPSLPPSIRRALEELATAAHGPFGRTPLAQLAVAHFELFAELRRLGATWAQIATLLAAHGIVAQDGPFDVGTLRATLSRAGGMAVGSTPRSNAQRASATERNEGKLSETNGDEANHTASQRNAISRREAHRGTPARRAAKQNATQRNLRSAATIVAGAADRLDQRDGALMPPDDVSNDVTRRAGILLQTSKEISDG
jgi:hypothetical protein